MESVRVQLSFGSSDGQAERFVSDVAIKELVQGSCLFIKVDVGKAGFQRIPLEMRCKSREVHGQASGRHHRVPPSTKTGGG